MRRCRSGSALLESQKLLGACLAQRADSATAATSSGWDVTGVSTLIIAVGTAVLAIDVMSRWAILRPSWWRGQQQRLGDVEGNANANIDGGGDNDSDRGSGHSGHRSIRSGGGGGRGGNARGGRRRRKHPQLQHGVGRGVVSFGPFAGVTVVSGRRVDDDGGGGGREGGVPFFLFSLFLSFLFFCLVVCFWEKDS